MVSLAKADYVLFSNLLAEARGNSKALSIQQESNLLAKVIHKLE